MLYLVIETFRNANPVPIGERFKSKAGCYPRAWTYQSSWIDREIRRCYQIMESENPTLLADWTKNWNDLIDFEIIPVQTSADFWANLPKK